MGMGTMGMGKELFPFSQVTVTSYSVFFYTWKLAIKFLFVGVNYSISARPVATGLDIITKFLFLRSDWEI